VPPGAQGCQDKRRPHRGVNHADPGPWSVRVAQDVAESDHGQNEQPRRPLEDPSKAPPLPRGNDAMRVGRGPAGQEVVRLQPAQQQGQSQPGPAPSPLADDGPVDSDGEQSRPHQGPDRCGDQKARSDRRGRLESFRDRRGPPTTRMQRIDKIGDETVPTRIKSR